MKKITINLSVDNCRVKEIVITKTNGDCEEVIIVDIPHDFSIDESIKKIKEYIK